MHQLTLRLDEFGWQALEAEAGREHESVDELLASAASYFASTLPSGRAAALAPRFKLSVHGAPRQVRIELSRDRWEQLEAEAGRQSVSLERLLEHAALLYLADLDSGRVASRVLGDAGEAEAESS
jgi:predicted DNA-binding ribbon-helix-helix protein